PPPITGRLRAALSAEHILRPKRAKRAYRDSSEPIARYQLFARRAFPGEHPQATSLARSVSCPKVRRPGQVHIFERRQRDGMALENLQEQAAVLLTRAGRLVPVFQCLDAVS